MYEHVLGSRTTNNNYVWVLTKAVCWLDFPSMGTCYRGILYCWKVQTFPVSKCIKFLDIVVLVQENTDMGSAFIDFNPSKVKDVWKNPTP